MALNRKTSNLVLFPDKLGRHDQLSAPKLKMVM